ncbi:ABC transporter ATP-binding protein [Streptomyces morookaense]|uniref:ABC transporter ATP-binding protein n=1 Tax=Streptomyces morookaense TaxID=1970 RepID=UPI0019AD2FB9|nr:ABC transporter ATP-binding protein [Streptomyces morookaense]GHF36191.1 nitrate ABC transporter ATP-binding protein [Streptomyces morookaense]
MNTPATEQPGPVLAAEDIDCYFVSPEGEVLQALDQVSLAVEDGEFVCVVGPSGCGKSTLLRVLGGLDAPSGGSVRLRPGLSVVPPVAFVFQDFGVLPWLTVRANAAFGLRMAGVGRRLSDRVADRWLGRVGLSEFADAYPGRLSGGMRQRLALARAFASGSPVLLMDEPLGALDPQTRVQMQEHLLELWQQEHKTVVMVTHSIDEALLLGDRVLVMSDRPGTVTDTITVPFPRPRTAGIQDTPAFARLRVRVRQALRGSRPGIPAQRTDGADARTDGGTE